MGYTAISSGSAFWMAGKVWSFILCRASGTDSWRTPKSTRYVRQWNKRGSPLPSTFVFTMAELRVTAQVEQEHNAEWLINIPRCFRTPQRFREVKGYR